MLKKRKNENKILVLDDDLDILELLQFILEKEGYEVQSLNHSRDFENITLENKFSLYIIDRNLPCIEGTDLIKKLRESGDKTAVIFLTAKNSREEKLEGFIKGGDDYITKPFDKEELLLRVEALLRRVDGNYSNSLSYKDITLDFNKFEVNIGKYKPSLTKLEFKLLETFLNNIENVLDRDTLLDIVWNCTAIDEHCNEKSVNVAIKRLKAKIDPDGEKNYIKAIRGIGYKFS
jgi:DNA-binding response OmpR family regulator